MANVAGLSFDLSQLKCLKCSSFDTIGKPNTVVIEFKKRFEYFFNPATDQFEKEEITDFTEIEFTNWDLFRTYRRELEEIWEDYLNKNS